LLARRYGSTRSEFGRAAVQEGRYQRSKSNLLDTRDAKPEKTEINETKGNKRRDKDERESAWRSGKTLLVTA